MNPLLDYLKTIPFEVEIYHARISVGISNLDRKWYVKYLFRHIKFFRYSIRYQYGIEKSKAEWVFVTHNDMIYKKDLLEKYLNQIGDFVGIGDIGQCWNCPAYGDCSGEKYLDYRPTKKEIFKLYEGKENLRGHKIIQKNYNGWPLPECRLNEHAALLNRNILKNQTFPKGNIEPIGYNSYETGINFFAKLSRRGFKFKHLSHHLFAEHAYFSKKRNGHSSFIDKNLYVFEENKAREIVENNIDEFIESLT